MAYDGTTPFEGIGTVVSKDSTSGFYFIPFCGIHIWIGTGGAPDHHALAIGDLCLDKATGYWYSATDVAGTWEKLNN